jgi:hypothetical protein
VRNAMKKIIAARIFGAMVPFYLLLPPGWSGETRPTSIILFVLLEAVNAYAFSMNLKGKGIKQKKPGSINSRHSDPRPGI